MVRSVEFGEGKSLNFENEAALNDVIRFVDVQITKK